MRRILFLPSTWISKFLFRILGINYGKSFSAIGFPICYQDKSSSITLGEKVTFVSNTLGNLIGLFQRTIVVARLGGKIKIGSESGLSGMTIYSIKNIEIGDYFTGGANSKIIDHDFHPLDSKARMERPLPWDKVKRGEIKIGRNVFLGTGSIVLRDTIIGDNCIIGAGSVVKGKFPDNCVIAGNPAKIVKMLNIGRNKK